MTVDYAGCDWWDGGTIELSGCLRRLDGDQAAMEAYPRCFAPQDSPVPATCEILLELDHPSHEVARYHGTISYRWDDEVRTERLALRFTGTSTMRTCVWDDSAA